MKPSTFIISRDMTLLYSAVTHKWYWASFLHPYTSIEYNYRKEAIEAMKTNQVQWRL